MGVSPVSSSSLAFNSLLISSILLAIVSTSPTLALKTEEDSINNIPNDYKNPEVKIGVEIISSRDQGSGDNPDLNFLINSWWKILAWSLAVLVLSILCCYFSRCCYLCYDCCSDPFWGCCPHSRGCSRFLLFKGTFFETHFLTENSF